MNIFRKVSRGAKRYSLCIIIIIGTVISIMITLLCGWELKTTKNPNIARKLLKPPSFISEKFEPILIEILNQNKKDKDKKERFSSEKVLQVVSDIVQEQLTQLQNPKDCNGLNIICGSDSYRIICGLGCQIHHRIACLMASYALGVPLIHDESHWSYDDPWGEAFLPLGSKCRPGNQTYRLMWKKSLHLFTFDDVHNIKYLEYPLTNGVVVWKLLGDLVEKHHQFPFTWWVGQFVKFGLQLNAKQQKILEETKLKLQFEHPIAGIHVRRTDKNTVQRRETFHNVSSYMRKVELFYNNTFNNATIMKNVFITSDDANIFQETRLKYPISQNWNVLGFNNRKTYSTPGARRKALSEMVLDLFLLSECDFIVCGFTSNVCGLLLEIMNYKHIDGTKRTDGFLDGFYHYQKYLNRKLPISVVKVEQVSA